MTANFSFVAHTAQRLADKLTPRGLRDRTAKRRLTNTRRANEAQDRALQLIGARLHREIFDDPVLDLLKCIMVRIEDGLRRRDILLQLGLLAPGQAEENIQIVAHDSRFGRHRCHRLQLLDLGRRLGARVLGQLHAVDLVLKLLNLVAIALFALVAEFALNGL